MKQNVLNKVDFKGITNYEHKKDIMCFKIEQFYL